MDESTFMFRGIGCDFSFLFHFLMKFMSANRIASDGMASHLGLFCLPMSHKKDARLIWIKDLMILKVFYLGSGRQRKTWSAALLFSYAERLVFS